MYLRAAKTEAEEAGESTDGMANSVSELRKGILSLTNNRVDIQIDEDTFKSTYQILKELSAVWGDLSDVTQANILEQIGGKRNANVVSALLNNFDIAERVVETSANSAGSALAENEKVLESITGHINRFKAAFENMSASIVDSDVVKTLLDIGTAILNIIGKLFEVSDALEVVARTLLILVGSMAIKNLGRIASLIAGIPAKIERVLPGVTTAIGAYKTAVVGAGTGMRAAAAGAKAFAASLGVLGTITLGATAIFAVLIPLYNRFKQRQEDERNATIESAEAASTLSENLSDLVSQYESVSAAVEDGTSSKEELLSVQDQLIESLGLEQWEINSLTDKYGDATDKLREYTKAKLEDAEIDLKAGKITREEELLEAAKPTWFGRNNANSIEIGSSMFSSDPEKELEARRYALSALADAGYINWSDKINGVQNFEITQDFDLSNVNGVIAAYDRLGEMLKVVSNSAGENNDVFKELYAVYSRLSESVGNYEDIIGDLNENLAVQQVQGYMAGKALPQTKETFELYRDEMIAAAQESGEFVGSEQDVANAIDGVLSSQKQFAQFYQTEMPSAIETVDSLFKDLYTTVESLASKKSLLETLRDSVADGSISDSTLKSLYEQYDVMGDIITQYRLGLATAEDVYAEYERLYKEDESELFSATRWKIGLSEDYFNENIKGNAEWIKKLGTFYTADFKNYQGLADKKAKIDDQLIKILGANWSKYYKSYATALRAAITTAQVNLSESEFSRSSGMVQQYGTYENYISKTTGGLPDLLGTAELLDSIAVELENIDLSIDVPGDGNSSKVEEYIADIDEYREAIERLNRTKLSVETLGDELEDAEDAREKIALRTQLLALYQAEADAQNDLNKLRRAGIASGVDKLRGIGFNVEYDAESDKFYVDNLEHLNELTAASKGSYKSLQEATNAYRKEVEEEIEALEKLNEENQDGEKNVRSLTSSIRDARQTIIDDLKSILTTASEAVDSIQDVYDTLKSAAEEYSSNGGFISIDTFQSLIALGPQYMQYLKNENGLLSITREKIEEVIAAKTEQLALENALSYVERLRLALQEGSIEQLNELLYATTNATNATWGLVYANLGLLGLSGDEYRAALHNIDAIRSLAESARSGLSFSSMKADLDDLIQYVMDMLKDKVEEQKEALEDMKDAYADLIELKKESLEASKDEADYQKDVAKKLKEIAKLQAKIDALSLDTSREAQAERAKLIEEMAELQDELAEKQRDNAIEKQSEALDTMQEKYEEQKDAEIKALEETISSEEKLYRLAIKHISDNWATLYDELIDWNTEQGSVINSEITAAWEKAAEAVRLYGGNVKEALEATANGAIGNGSIVGYSGDYDHSSTTDEQVYAYITQMKANSLAWHTATKEGRKTLESQNAAYAKAVGELIGEELFLDKNGVWRIGSMTGEELYKKYAGIYHTGGVVGEVGTMKENEALAKLENGEIVVSNQNKRTLFSLIDFVSSLKKTIDTSHVGDLYAKNHVDAVRELTNVTNNRSGDIRLGDVYIYGADESTVEKHKAVNREFANEILGFLRTKR